MLRTCEKIRQNIPTISYCYKVRACREIKVVRLLFDTSLYAYKNRDLILVINQFLPVIEQK